jgi:hypothetical protein
MTLQDLSIFFKSKNETIYEFIKFSKKFKNEKEFFYNKYKK